MTGAVPGWLHLLSDALGMPIDHVAVSRSTMRGAAVLALEQAAPGTAVAEAPVLTHVEPVAAHRDHYRERLERFEALADLACGRSPRALGPPSLPPGPTPPRSYRRAPCAEPPEREHTRTTPESSPPRPSEQSRHPTPTA